MYVGGGDTESGEEGYLVCKYDPVNNEWSSLQHAPVRSFGIGQLNGKLVLVGGKLRQTGRRTADVHVFEENQQWEKSIPAMPSPCSAAAVLSHNNSLVVGGGSDTRGEPCATIFVYSCLTSKWSSPGSLPFACWRQSSMVLHNSCFVAGGYYGLIFNQQRRSVISIILPSCSVVENLPDMPHYDSTIATIDGSILAVGGIPTAAPKSLFAPYLYSDRISSEVYAYCPTASTWTRIGDLPAPRNRVATATLPSGELLVMGGGKRESNFCDTVFMGSIETIE